MAGVKEGTGVLMEAPPLQARGLGGVAAVECEVMSVKFRVIRGGSLWESVLRGHIIYVYKTW
jgi:hypothetical protein